MKSSKLWHAIESCSVPSHYAAMHEAFAADLSLDVDLEQRDLSHALYFQLAKIKYAAWRHKVNFNRARRHSLSDLFQDLVAFYLRAALPKEFQISLEEAKNVLRDGKEVKLQPDICIRLDGQMHFVIEVKTTIGWARPDFQSGSDPYIKLARRIDEIEQAFGVARDRIAFVFEEPTNVHSKLFLPHFWDAQRQAPVVRPDDGVLAHIYPLYMTTDPFYWNWKDKIPEGRDQGNWIPEIADDLILARAKTSVVTPFESILDLIQSAR